MTKDELLNEAMELLAKVYDDTRTELKIRLTIPKLMREYIKLVEKDF